MLMLTTEFLALPGIAHGFFGREGGVSEGVYASLNCGPGSGDSLEAVNENRARAMRALAPGARLVTPYQVHGAMTVTVTDPWEMGEGPKADAVVTNRPGLALGVLTADCAPVLIADEQARVVAAAHAGWGGALAGIVESVVAAMEDLGAERSRMRAVIGPCIHQKSYEVGPEFEARFMLDNAANSRFFLPSGREDHWLFDLSGYVAQRLTAAGVGTVEPSPVCTYEHERNFFSYRRATHRQEPDYGRELSAIAML